MKLRIILIKGVLNMANDRFTVVGTNIAEKASMIWNVADMLA